MRKTTQRMQKRWRKVPQQSDVRRGNIERRSRLRSNKRLSTSSGTSSEPAGPHILELRDRALRMLRSRGEWTPASSGPRLLTASVGSLRIAYRTPFQPPEPLNQPDHYDDRPALSMTEPELPYGLDVWAPRKVLSLQWANGQPPKIRLYEPGDWEELLQIRPHP